MNWKTLKNDIQQTNLTLIREETHDSVSFTRYMLFFFCGRNKKLSEVEKQFPNQVGFGLMFEKNRYFSNRAFIYQVNEKQEWSEAVYKYEAKSDTLTEQYKAIKEKLLKIMENGGLE